jgi:hypothetical protein
LGQKEVEIITGALGRGKRGPQHKRYPRGLGYPVKEVLKQTRAAFLALIGSLAAKARGVTAGESRGLDDQRLQSDAGQLPRAGKPRDSGAYNDSVLFD